MKKVKFISIAVCWLAVLFVFNTAHADLQNLGTDILGNRLIYDTDLDVTWYDYTNPGNSWQNQMDWADALTVNFGGHVYEDWRLPSTVDGPFDWSFRGTTTGGFNITSSEMGHLFYTEMANQGYYDTSGNETGCGYGCLTNTGDFQNLHSYLYWSGTEYSSDPSEAWYFAFYSGSQLNISKNADWYGLAVRSGLPLGPEPISSTLFIVGGATLGFRHFRKKFMK